MENWLFNHLSVTKTQGGWKPSRFTDDQLTEYAKKEVHRLRCQCPTGVVLSLRTDSKWLRLSYTFIQKMRDYAYFDLFVDGNWVSSEGDEQIGLGSGACSFTLPEQDGMRRIDLYLPHTVELELHELELSPGALAEPVEPRPKRILCLGDSITQGLDAKHPSNTYPVLIANFLNMQLLNQGVGGYYFNANALDVNLPYQPELITVAYGTNDRSKYNSIEEFRTHVGSYLRKLASMFPRARIFMMTPIWCRSMHEVRGTGSFLDLGRVISEESLSYSNVRVIEGLSLVPHLSRLFDNKAGTHPSDEGFLHMAMNIVKQIRQDSEEKGLSINSKV